MTQYLFVVFCLFLCTTPIYGNVPTLDGFSDAQLETVVQEFAANFVHTSATPATYRGICFFSTNGRLAGRAATATPNSLFDDLTSAEKSSRQESIRLIAGAALHLTSPLLILGSSIHKFFLRTVCLRSLAFNFRS